MAQIPATCKNCGLIFPSPCSAAMGLIVQDSRYECPRCGAMAPAINGYTVLIDGMVTFIASPDHSRETKQALIDTAKAVARGEIKAAEASSLLDKKSEAAGKLLREWITVGSTFVAAMAAAATFLLAYIEKGKNEPPEQPVMEAVDRFLCYTPQWDQRIALGPAASIRPPSTLGDKHDPKKSQADSSGPKPPNENRKTRRARIATMKKRRPKARE